MPPRTMKTLDAATQAELRQRVMTAVADGMGQSEAARTFGVGARSVRRWVAQIKVDGPEAIAPKRRGRRTGEAGALTARQAERIKRLVIGRLPDQLKLPFYLWTREAVRRLIVREYGVRLGLSAVGNYLKAWGLSPQRPVRRAYERDPEAIARWLKREYPKITRAAKRERAVIYWGDESGLRSNDVRGRSYAVRGQTPVVAATGQRFGCNMISALSNRGALAFRVFMGRFVSAVFIDFLERLLQHAGRRKLYLIVDGHPVHKSRAVSRWIEAHADRLRLIFLPGYAPELNPDELLNHDVKQAIGRTRPRTRADLMAATRAWLHRRQKQPEVIRNFFREEHVRYAA
jgi:transposase